MGYQNLITGMMFVICTIEDIKSRRISTRNIILYSIFVFGGKPTEILTGMIPGVSCLVLSFLTHQKIGYGDSLIILLSGVSLGMEQEMIILISAFFLSGIWAIISLIRKKAERDSEFPFLPFLFLGWCLSVKIFP